MGTGRFFLAFLLLRYLRHKAFWDLLGVGLPFFFFHLLYLGEKKKAGKALDIFVGVFFFSFLVGLFVTTTKGRLGVLLLIVFSGDMFG
ncbi:hypothetical protein QBC40DRAFT_290647 [Triangularia verruculosa]|uniref:Uncharacterized protein n=1 Tax=Triangularia verruculosa TaxID=2587418 RepID=A0AAN6X6F0_9PEZI|nr:hypothetical protein QBC40DRAFT_290647 [Triangularia verruculosa]